VDGRRENLARLGEALTGKAAANIKPLAELMAGIAPSGAPLADRVQKAWDFYRPVMENIYDDWPKRMADVNELLRIAGNYRSLDQFLADVTLEPPNALNPRGRTLADKLVLSTIHSAKGLEWKVVFIIGASEGRFPAPYVQNKPDELEEERRLMYVAATRAEDELHIVCPLEASFDGGASPRPAPSRFIADVPPGLLESGREEARPQARAAPAAEPPPVASGAEEDGLSPGRRVSHPVFGLGRVLRRPDGKKIKIDFDHFGVKTLHIDYAGLKSAG
jgi:DNA helicase-2/ATP-dependent DNA helicase PcrA